MIVGNLLRISHKNKLNYFDNESLLELKENVYSYLESLGEVNENDALKYFQKKDFDFSDIDSFNNSVAISKSLILADKHNLISGNKIKELIDTVISKGIQKSAIILNETNVYNIAKVLIKCFNDIVAYNINNKNEFIAGLNYKEIKVDDLMPTRASSFCEVNRTTMSKLKEISNNKIKVVPEYIINLRDDLMFVKTLEISIPSNKEVNVLFYILIMLNIGWLFSNILEVNINFDNKKLKVSDKKTYELFKTNANIYEVVLLIPLFICNIGKIHSLKLNLNESYQAEIDYLLKSEKILTTNFHLVDMMNITNSLIYLDLNFNSLDSNTFKRMLTIIHNNNNLRFLSLNLFPKDEDFNQESIINLSNIFDFNFHKRSSFNSIVDENEFLLDNLVSLYEANLEALLFVLQMKLNLLKVFKINFDLPSIIFQNDKYNACIFKFIINIFKLLDSKDLHLQTFEISSSNFSLNSRINSYLERLFNDISIYNNQSISNYYINFRFYKIKNIMHIIPKNLEYLSLSDFDTDTLEYFTNNFRKYDFFKKLKILKISINNIYFDLKKIDVLYSFFSTKKKNIKEIHLQSKLKLDKTIIDKIVSIIRKTSVQQYNLTFGKISNLLSYKNKEFTFFEINPKIYTIVGILQKKNLNDRNILKLVNNCLKKKNTKIININLI